MDTEVSAELIDPRGVASGLSIAVVNYGMGNLRSVVHALEFLGCKPRLAGSAEAIEGCDAIILPGVGAFGEAMGALERQNLNQSLSEVVTARKTPFLGICLGMQLIAKASEEHGHHEGLGWIDGTVRQIDPKNGRVPHVGWNCVAADADDPLFEGIDPKASFYFDHSFHVAVNDGARIASVDFGGPMVAALSSGNLYATQFHPEKSQRAGLKLLRNFLNIAAAAARRDDA